MHEIKEMDLGGVLGNTFKLVFTKDFFKFGLFYLILSILLFIVLSIIITGVILILGFTNVVDFNTLSDFDFNDSILLIVLVVSFYAVLVILSLLLIFYFNGSVIDLFSNTFLNKEWKIKECIKRVLKIFFRIIIYYLIYGTALLFSVGIIIGGLIGLWSYAAYSENTVLMVLLVFLTAIISIISFALYVLIDSLLMIALPSIIFENTNIITSLKRSFKLFKANFWSIFFTNALFFIMMIFLNYIIQFMITFVLYFIFIIVMLIAGSGSIENIFSNNQGMIAFTIVIYSVAVPMTYCIYLLIYGLRASFKTTIFFNQKIRVEGFGVQLLAESMINEENNKLENVQES